MISYNNTTGSALRRTASLLTKAPATDPVAIVRTEGEYDETGFYPGVCDLCLSGRQRFRRRLFSAERRGQQRQ